MKNEPSLQGALSETVNAIQNGNVWYIHVYGQIWSKIKLFHFENFETPGDTSHAFYGTCTNAQAILHLKSIRGQGISASLCAISL